MLRTTLALAGVMALSLSAAQAQTAPAANPRVDDPRAADPWEKANRGLYLVGGALDVVAIRPSAVFYKHVTPRPVRDGVHNLMDNLGQPVVVFNRVLQLRPGPAAGAAGRFVLNTTVGIGGVFDVASGAGLPAQSTSFGDTLGRYGVARGPYLFLPVLGPSSVRDAAGEVVDVFLDPFTWINFHGRTYFQASRVVLTGVDARVRADPTLRYIQKNATDPYATLRSAYLQNANFLDGGGKVDVNALPDFGPEPAAAANPTH